MKKENNSPFCSRRDIIEAVAVVSVISAIVSVGLLIPKLLAIIAGV